MGLIVKEFHKHIDHSQEGQQDLIAAVKEKKHEHHAGLHLFCQTGASIKDFS